MCEHCGCGFDATVTALNLQTGRLMTLHDHSHGHDHGDGIPHAHASGHSHRSRHEELEIEIRARVLAKNDALAQSNRNWLADRELLAINVMSGPGSGKTTLLERTIPNLQSESAVYVLEGDQATSQDAERVRKAGAAAVVQVNTGTGCHLDAHMVAHGLADLRPKPRSIIFIENVGNLVCPALFDLGEKRRVAIFSTTEGEDKPLKYPYMFRDADLVILNKIDLLPHLDFDADGAIENVRSVNPAATVLRLSARTEDGIGAWYRWIRNEAAAIDGIRQE